MGSSPSALDGLGTMPRTIQCPQCGVVLNVPEAAAGRRLKCPKCATKFAADGGPPPPRPSSSTFGTGRGMASSVTLPASSGDDFDLPTAPGSLRETFDLPLLGEDAPPSRPVVPTAPAAEADPMALLRGDDDAPSRRRPLAAEARAQARRCPTCGSVVPRGMSLCSTCGLDLESGTRVDLTEDLEVHAPIRRTEIPIGSWVVGGLSIFVSFLFALISLIQWQKEDQVGYLLLLPVCLFGIFASVQFLRVKSFKLLLIALTLGVAIDIVAMIILPVALALSEVEVQHNPGEDAAIQSVNERLDTTKLSWGVALIFSYIAVAWYLNSPPVRRRFR